MLDGLKQVEEIRRLNRSQEQQAVELVKSAAALREQTGMAVPEALTRFPQSILGLLPGLV